MPENSPQKLLAAIPSYARTEVLVRAVAALRSGNCVPDEIWVLFPKDDTATAECCATLEVRSIPHKGWGHLGPLAKLTALLDQEDHGMDWVYILDDDAFVRSDTVEKLFHAVCSESLAGAGGRVINYIDGVQVTLEPVTEVGYISWWGALQAGFHHPYVGPDPVYVRHLQGCSMMWKADYFAAVQWDMRLNRYVARRYEVALGEEISQHGLPIRYVPDAVIDHHPAPRKHVSERNELVKMAEATGASWTIILRRFLPPGQRQIAVCWWIAWGDAESPGILRALLLALLPGRQGIKRLIAGLKGRANGLFVRPGPDPEKVQRTLQGL